METNDTITLPKPPSLLACLMSGFDAITAHVALILFPVALDLLIWLGPRFKLTTVINDLIALQKSDPSQNAAALQASQQMLQEAGGRLNLLAILRTYPVGIPSIMAGRMPVQTPPGIALVNWDVTSFPLVILIGFAFMLSGLIFSSLYFKGVADAAILGRLSFGHMFNAWPYAALQTFLLTLIWGVFFLVISIPASCVIFALGLASPAIGQLAVMAYAVGLLWLAFPVLISPHGIFIYNNNGIASLTRGLRIIRLALPTTALMFLMLFLLSEGLNVLWRVTPENSWLSLIGVFGHAFVTTGILAASFIYYRDADQWVQKMMTYWAQVPPVQSKI